MGIEMPETCRVIYDNKYNFCIKLVPLVKIKVLFLLQYC